MKRQWPDAQRWLFLGRSRMGKTHLARLMLARLLAERDIAIVHDKHVQYPGYVWRSVGQFKQAAAWPKVNVFPFSPVEEITDLAMWVAGYERSGGEYQRRRAVRKRQVVLVIDEIDMAATAQGYIDTPKAARGERRSMGPLWYIVQQGRWFGIDLVGCSRQPRAVHGSLRGNSDRIYCFRLTEPNDLDWVEEAAGSQFRQVVERLAPRTYCLFDPNDTSDIEPHFSG